MIRFLAFAALRLFVYRCVAAIPPQEEAEAVPITPKKCDELATAYTQAVADHGYGSEEAWAASDAFYESGCTVAGEHTGGVPTTPPHRPV